MLVTQLCLTFLTPWAVACQSPLSMEFSSQEYGVKEKKVKSLSRVRLCATPWTVDYQASLSMEFSRQESCIELPFPSPGDVPHLGIEAGSPAL